MCLMAAASDAFAYLDDAKVMPTCGLKQVGDVCTFSHECANSCCDMDTMTCSAGSAEGTCNGITECQEQDYFAWGKERFLNNNNSGGDGGLGALALLCCCCCCILACCVICCVLLGFELVLCCPCNLCLCIILLASSGSNN